jgi:hypothetical protein
MNLTRNENREKEIFDRIRKNFQAKDAERSAGIKLSDLLYPKKAYWQKKNPMPPTNDDINYWVIGRGHEDVMHRVSELNKPDSKIWEGIYYGMDFQEAGVPIEMKTRRGYLAKEGDEIKKYDTYLRQLIGYCAIEKIEHGELWVWSLLEKTDTFRSAPKMVCYDVNFEQVELERERLRLLGTRDILVKALNGDKECYDMLSDCPEWQCKRKETNMIKPPFCKTCNKEFKTEFGIESHINSRTGNGHEVVHATYDIKIIPTCKHYPLCKGVEDVVR